MLKNDVSTLTESHYRVSKANAQSRSGGMFYGAQAIRSGTECTGQVDV